MLRAGDGASTAAAAASAATAVSARPADTPPPTGHLDDAIGVPRLAALNVDGTADVKIVRCGDPAHAASISQKKKLTVTK